MIDYYVFNEQVWGIQHMFPTHFTCLIKRKRRIILMNIWASSCTRKKKQKTNNFILTNPPLSFYTLCILPFGPKGAFWYAPSLLARLYFFIRPSGGCRSPGGCQSTLILIRTWVLSGVNGSQQLSTQLSIPLHLIYHPQRALPTNTCMQVR